MTRYPYTNIIAQHVPPKTRDHIQRNLNFALQQAREFETLLLFWEREVKACLEELERLP
jgi:hypothetical protein